MDNKSQTNIWFVITWFATTIISLIFALTFSVYLAYPKLIKPSEEDFQLYIALPKSTSLISEEIETADGRAKIIADFFTNHKSPLFSYSDIFLDVAKKYNLDWRLLPAIAMQESKGGKRIIANSYNPFGYGNSDKTVVKFSSWQDAIEKVGKALKENYLDQGLKTPAQIMTKYTSPSLAKNGSWAEGVSSFISELR